MKRALMIFAICGGLLVGLRADIGPSFLRGGVRPQQEGHAQGESDEDRVAEPARLLLRRRAGRERHGRELGDRSRRAERSLPRRLAEGLAEDWRPGDRRGVPRQSRRPARQRQVGDPRERQKSLQRPKPRTRPRTTCEHQNIASARCASRWLRRRCPDRSRHSRAGRRPNGGDAGHHRSLGRRPGWTRHPGSREIHEEPGADDSVHAARRRTLQERRPGEESERLLPAAGSVAGADRAVAVL